jgi:endonuclease G, mitochondrial
MKSARQERSSNRLLLLLFLFILFLALFLFVSRNRQGKASAAVYAIDSTVLNQLQIPAIKASDEIVQHSAYTLSYNEDHEQANWVAYVLTASETNSANNERTNRFLPDPLVRTKSASTIDYKGTSYDRGHLAPAEDMAWSKTTMKESFYYTNISPQLPAFNRGVWRRLEELVRYWSTVYDSIYIVTGPVLTDGLATIGPDKVSVPSYFYKVVLEYNSKGAKGIGFLLKNEASAATLKSFAVSIDSIEHLTGIDFFPKLPNEQENKIEAEAGINQWKWTRKQ